MRKLLLTLSLPLGLALSFCARASDSTPEAARLQATWRSVAAERNGAPAPGVVGHKLAFTGDHFQITRDGKLLYGGTYAIEFSADPARIDFRQDEGGNLRGEWRGIYRFEASRLEIIDNADDTSKPRPIKFVTAPGSGYVLVRFEWG